LFGREEEIMPNVICGWCKQKFFVDIYVDKRGDRNLVKCPHCARLLPSSRRVTIGICGKKHYHDEYVNGDVV
jgi:hypothetical protein